MKTLIIYDENGYIYVPQMSGNYLIPAGVKYLEIEIPDGKYVESVDISIIPHQAILKDLPLGEMDILKIRLNSTENAIIALMDMSMMNI